EHYGGHRNHHHTPCSTRDAALFSSCSNREQAAGCAFRDAARPHRRRTAGGRTDMLPGGAGDGRGATQVGGGPWRVASPGPRGLNYLVEGGLTSRQTANGAACP